MGAIKMEVQPLLLCAVLSNLSNIGAAERAPVDGLLRCGIFAPIFLLGFSKNSPFAIWPDVLSQLCVMKIPQYTKHSGISITEFGTKFLAQIIKNEFLEEPC
jgi:hypothetical protein